MFVDLFTYSRTCINVINCYTSSLHVYGINVSSFYSRDNIDSVSLSIPNECIGQRFMQRFLWFAWHAYY